MNTNTYTEHEESTYALLVRSEQEERTLPETGVFVLLILAMAFSVWQIARQPFHVPSFGLSGGAIVQVAEKSNPPA